jgi:hypothetical protein
MTALQLIFGMSHSNHWLTDNDTLLCPPPHPPPCPPARLSPVDVVPLHPPQHSPHLFHQHDYPPANAVPLHPPQPSPLLPWRHSCHSPRWVHLLAHLSYGQIKGKAQAEFPQLALHHQCRCWQRGGWLCHIQYLTKCHHFSHPHQHVILLSDTSLHGDLQLIPSGGRDGHMLFNKVQEIWNLTTFVLISLSTSSHCNGRRRMKVLLVALWWTRLWEGPTLLVWATPLASRNKRAKKPANLFSNIPIPNYVIYNLQDFVICANQSQITNSV